MFGIILIIVGLTLTIFGIGFVISPKQENEVKLASEITEVKPTENLSNLVEKPLTTSEIAEGKTKQESETTETSRNQATQDGNLAEQKGLDFTKAVIAKFDKKYFKLKEWRSDKYEDGEVYVIPLASIENIFITQEELKKYKKVDFDDKNLFYDSKTQILK